jgi:hypothetical protein
MPDGSAAPAKRAGDEPDRCSTGAGFAAVDFAAVRFVDVRFADVRSGAAQCGRTAAR